VAKNNKRHLGPSFNTSLPPRGPRVDVPVESVSETRPVWRIGLMDMDGPWGWGTLDAEQVRQILERLRCFETMKWREIENTPSCGSMELNTMCADAKERLTEIRRDDIDSLFKLRVTKSARVWGVRSGSVFEVLWWDPEHSVYPMNIADN
jgi:hypothetical protein